MPLNLGQILMTMLLSIGSMPNVIESPSALQLIERNLKEKSPVWSDGNTATFFYRGELEEVGLDFGGETRSLMRLAESDVWTLAIKLPELERGIFSYQFLPKEFGQPVAEPSAKYSVWRGPKAAPAAVECDELKGRLQTVDVPSKKLGAPRRVTVYLPPGHDRQGKCRVVYAADGDAIDDFTRILEPLILSGKIPPVVIIGVHSGGYLGGDVANIKDYDPEKDLRAKEYVPGISPQRFAEHESFFCTEIVEWAEREFAVSPDSGERVVFGYSNGGRFAVEMGLRHPDLFGHVFAFSVAGDWEFANLPLGPATRPHYYLAAGIWEKGFHHNTSILAKELKHRGLPVEFSSRVSGHDLVMWSDEFAAALTRAFGVTSKR